MRCEEGSLSLAVTWQTGAIIPEENLSVFVKAYDPAGELVAQGDQVAPVYGWRPLTSWLAGESIHDIYPLAAAPETCLGSSATVYTERHAPVDVFEDVLSYEVRPDCQ